MILSMLHWVIGEKPFDKTMRTFITQYSGKSVSVDDLRKVAEQASGQQLNWFFTQWLNSTGAPEFKNKYTVYRTARKAFAWSARSRRTWTCSACRWS